MGFGMLAGPSGYDHLFKLIIIGDSGVGKSSLMERFSSGKFSPIYITTIGVDFATKTISIGQQRIRLQLWDTAGQERFRTITSVYYRDVQGVLLVFDVGNYSSFLAIKRWAYEVDEHSQCFSKRVLVGNKCDSTERQVTIEEAEKLAAELRVDYFETSASTGHQVEEVFVHLTEQILAAKPAHRRRPSVPGFTLAPTPKADRKFRVDKADAVMRRKSDTLQNGAFSGYKYYDVPLSEDQEEMEAIKKQAPKVKRRSCF